MTDVPEEVLRVLEMIEELRRAIEVRLDCERACLYAAVIASAMNERQQVTVLQ